MASVCHHLGMGPIDPIDVYKILRDERIEYRRAEDHKELAALVRDSRRLGEIDLLVKLEDPVFRTVLGQAVARNASAFLVGDPVLARRKKVRQSVHNGGFSTFTDVVATLLLRDQAATVGSSESQVVRDLRPAKSHVHEHAYGDDRPGLTASIIYRYREGLLHR